MNKINQEQLEAIQLAGNKKTENFRKTLSDSDEQKYLAVEKALKILTDANCAAFLFPMLKTPNYKSEDFINYNNFQDIFKNNSGFYNEEKMGSPWYKLTNFFIQFLSNVYGLDLKTSESTHELMNRFLQDAYHGQQKLIKGE